MEFEESNVALLSDENIVSCTPSGALDSRDMSDSLRNDIHCARELAANLYNTGKPEAARILLRVANALFAQSKVVLKLEE